MKILGLYLSNFGSFAGRHYIPLADRGIVSVIGENLDDPRAKSNGAGKSTVSDALDWCLWGDNPRNDTAAAVVCDATGKDCCATTHVLDDGGALIQITRTRDFGKVPNGPRVWVDGVEQTALDAKETQIRIEALLGLDREVFHAAVLHAQGDTWSFADATDGERKALLTRLLPELGEVDALQVKAQGLLQQARGAVQLAAQQYSEASVRLELLKGGSPSGLVDQWERDRAARVQTAQQEAAQRAGEVQRLADEFRALPVQTAPPVQTPRPDTAARQQEIARLGTQVQEGDVHLGGLRARVQTMVEQIAKLSDPRATTCAACGQRLTAEAIEHQRAALEEARTRKATLIEEGVRVRAQVDALRAQREALQQQVQREEGAWIQANAEVMRQQAVAQQVAQRRDALTAQARDAQAQQQRWLAAAQQAQQEVNPHAGRVQAWEMSVAQQHQVVGNLNQRLADLKRREAGLLFWVDGLGGKGLKSYLLDGRVAEMAHEANRWVKLLTGGVVWVEFSTQREVGTGKKKKLVDDLSIKVFRSNPDGTITERGYRSWSGGEKYRIALGIDFGLARLIARRARKTYDLLILDEVFQRSLDSTGKEAVAELLQALGQEKSSILVIDHDVQFQHLFDGQMIVRKKNRRSHVVGGIHHDVQSADSESLEQRAQGLLLASHPAFPG